MSALTTAQINRALPLAEIDWEHMAKRFILDQFPAALAAHWRRRAEVFDEVGTETADATALACRRHAWLIETYGISPRLAAELDEQMDIVVGELA